MKKKNAKSFRPKKGAGQSEFLGQIGIARRNGAAVTEREKQVLLEILARNLWGALYGDERYLRAFYEKLFGSEKKRRAFKFLKQWYCAATLCPGGAEAIMANPKLLRLIAAPLLHALKERDSEFFKCLAEAVGILEQREESNKTKYPGSRKKWLLEYGLQYRFEHTAHELNEQFVSKIWSVKDDKLRRECKSLGVDLKPDKRGRKPKLRPPSSGKSPKLKD